jgi:hypothetical protein
MEKTLTRKHFPLSGGLCLHRVRVFFFFGKIVQNIREIPIAWGQFSYYSINEKKKEGSDT